MSEISRASYSSQFAAIQPEVDKAFNDHIEMVGRSRKTISLDPYALVPLKSYEDLRDEYEDHVAEQAKHGLDIRPLVKATFIIDAATEDGLPHYTAELKTAFESMQEWNGIWTAEERSHGEIMIRDMEARGFMDMSSEWLPVREQNLAAGIFPKIISPADGLAYVATQELLTQVAHFQSARLMDASGKKTLRALGGDEGRHYRFYVSVLRAFARVNPDMALIAMRRQHEDDQFAMPGEKGIIGYAGLAKTIALSGVFDALTILEAQKQTIDEAGLLEVSPITDEGKAAQEWANSISSKQHRSWGRKQKLMEKLRQRAFSEIGGVVLRPFILGHTVEFKDNRFVPIDN